ncbi:uncharacterized protein PADG_03445 [Paracoccidioides brasiliensis Pb18]|uniref:Urease accessory protein UreD n=1 Tax=Paracoccidioides brasiliensis (strain Pb18) TaxID=502780 RepID=C1G575_PARBD|nr:uncharacterized protein PADG_03445 [Paracoccidioides brasiliensis Pb18]EEH47347.1 hypothetical protein PADG_03445 [Paracoccidioides brasiliensis Pb18]
MEHHKKPALKLEPPTVAPQVPIFPQSPPKNPFISPFASASPTIPGRGEVVLSLLSPSIPTISTLSYKYPLKLLTRTPATTLNSKYPESATTPVHLYLLTYGGGLLPGDHIEVSITQKPRTRLVVTTPQGSTKIYRTEGRKESHGARDAKEQSRSCDQTPSACKSRQILDVKLGSHSALCYLPEPSQPFANSQYEQTQYFTLLQDRLMDETANQTDKNNLNQSPSLCVLDWVSQGRAARGEDWSFHSWKGRNEIWSQDPASGARKLLLRDTVILEDETRHYTEESSCLDSSTTTMSSPNPHSPPISLSIPARTHPHGILGTLILHGPLFSSLSSFIMTEFTSQPRLGGRNWSSSAATSTPASANSTRDSSVLWTAARIRSNFVLVKFGARDFESAKEWLGGLMRREGSLVDEFGTEALGCL